jgi:hypothetical protein
MGILFILCLVIISGFYSYGLAIFNLYFNDDRTNYQLIEFMLIEY